MVSCGRAFIRLEDVCNERGRCDWRRRGVYRGCVDYPVVTFIYFGMGGVLDVRRSGVDVITFEDGEWNIGCRDILLFGDVTITVYFGDRTCVRSTLPCIGHACTDYFLKV